MNRENENGQTKESYDSGAVSVFAQLANAFLGMAARNDDKVPLSRAIFLVDVRLWIPRDLIRIRFLDLKDSNSSVEASEGACH